MENFEENKHEAENREENEIKITEQNIDMIRKSLEQHEQEDAPLAIINENIKLSVCNPIIKDGLQKYIIYTVKGSDPDFGNYQLTRRFSDFDHLRESLMARWPGCYVPSIPPKKSMGNLDPKFVEERRQGLDDFCRNIANLKHLYTSDEFKLFLAGNIVDLEKAFKNLPNQTNENLIEKYQKIFVLDPEIKSDNIGVRIDEFEVFLKKVRSMYSNFSEMARNCSVHRKTFNENFFVMINYLMPEYEKNFLSEYVDSSESKMVFTNRNDNHIGDLLKNAKTQFETNTYYKLFMKLSREQRDIDALQDAINIKKKYITMREKAKSKLEDHKADLHKLATKGGKPDAIEKLEKSIANDDKELQIISTLCDYILNILGREIDRLRVILLIYF